MKTTLEILKSAKAAAAGVSTLTKERKISALNAMADELLAAKNEILEANRLDVQAAKNTVSSVMIDRLTLNENRIADMANGIKNDSF